MIITLDASCFGIVGRRLFHVCSTGIIGDW